MFAGSLQAADSDEQIAQGGQVVGGMSGADGGAILAESDIADVVDRILNTPVTPAKALDLSGAHLGGWTAGQDDFGFLRHAHAFEMVCGAGDHRRLGGVGKSRVLRSDFEGENLTRLVTAVALVQSDVRRGEKNPQGP